MCARPGPSSSDGFSIQSTSSAAAGTCSPALGARCLVACGRDLLAYRLPPAERAPGLAVPVPRIAEVALHRVDDAVQPGGKRRLVVLNDEMGRLPVAGREQVDRTAQIAIRHVTIIHRPGG